MISGEFRILLKNGEELVLPNQFTVYGMQAVLRSAFWGVKNPWYIGLCGVIPADNVPISELNEPPIGVGGYQRVAMPLDKLHWGTLGNINGETYIESKLAVFTPDPDTVWEPQVNRIFITDGSQVIAISSAFPEGLINVSEELKVPYRLYFR